MLSDHRPRVLLADDHDHILNKAKDILAKQFVVVATLNDGRNVAQAAATLKPDILILDISMPCVEGIAAAREVRRLGLPVKLVFLTVTEDSDCVQVAVALGASYVLKHRMHLDLITALRETLAGRIFISPISALTAPIAR
jgi:DNA-binding NarL/FixJ family response regulator